MGNPAVDIYLPDTDWLALSINRQLSNLGRKYANRGGAFTGAGARAQISTRANTRLDTATAHGVTELLGQLAVKVAKR